MSNHDRLTSPSLSATARPDDAAASGRSYSSPSTSADTSGTGRDSTALSTAQPHGTPSSAASSRPAGASRPAGGSRSGFSFGAALGIRKPRGSAQAAAAAADGESAAGPPAGRASDAPQAAQRPSSDRAPGSANTAEGRPAGRDGSHGGGSDGSVHDMGKGSSGGDGAQAPEPPASTSQLAAVQSCKVSRILCHELQTIAQMCFCRRNEQMACCTRLTLPAPAAAALELAVPVILSTTLCSHAENWCIVPVVRRCQPTALPLKAGASAAGAARSQHRLRRRQLMTVTGRWRARRRAWQQQKATLKQLPAPLHSSSRLTVQTAHQP